ncbi:MAG: PEP-CTERM sorting domain-containing protein [Phycisphaerae bacterium]
MTQLSRLNRRIGGIVASVAALLCVGIASAQSLNIDIGRRGGTPSDTFGGPAGSPGFWNTLDVGRAGAAIVGLDGGATNVTLESTVLLGDPNFPGYYNPQPATAGDPDVAALLDDFVYLNGDVQSEFAFFGLQPGEYDLVVVGILVGFPNEPTDVTWLSDDLSEFQEDRIGDAAYGGTWQSGVTHARFRVPVGPSGELRFIANGVFSFDFESFGNINGIQLVLVPEPGTLAGLAMMVVVAAVGLRRRIDGKNAGTVR